MDTIEKILLLKNRILNSDSELKKIYLSIIDDFIDTMIYYIKTIFIAKSHRILSTFHSKEDYKFLIESNDRKRRIYHNNLIVSVKLIDNLCLMYNTPMVFGQLGKYLNDTTPIINPKTEQEKDINADISLFAIETISDLSGLNYTSEMVLDADKYRILDEYLSEISGEDIRTLFYSKIKKN